MTWVKTVTYQSWNRRNQCSIPSSPISLVFWNNIDIYMYLEVSTNKTARALVWTWTLSNGNKSPCWKNPVQNSDVLPLTQASLSWGARRAGKGHQIVRCGVVEALCKGSLWAGRGVGLGLLLLGNLSMLLGAMMARIYSVMLMFIIRSRRSGPRGSLWTSLEMNWLFLYPRIIKYMQLGVSGVKIMNPWKVFRFLT